MESTEPRMISPLETFAASVDNRLEDARRLIKLYDVANEEGLGDGWKAIALLPYAPHDPTPLIRGRISKLHIGVSEVHFPYTDCKLMVSATLTAHEFANWLAKLLENDLLGFGVYAKTVTFAGSLHFGENAIDKLDAKTKDKPLAVREDVVAAKFTVSLPSTRMLKLTDTCESLRLEVSLHIGNVKFDITLCNRVNVSYISESLCMFDSPLVPVKRFKDRNSHGDNVYSQSTERISSVASRYGLITQYVSGSNPQADCDFYFTDLENLSRWAEDLKARTFEAVRS